MLVVQAAVTQKIDRGGDRWATRGTNVAAFMKRRSQKIAVAAPAVAEKAAQIRQRAELIAAAQLQLGRA
jgi:hypothetical protein